MKVFFLSILFWSFSYNLHAQDKEALPTKYEMAIFRKNGDTTFVKVTTIKAKRLISEESFYLIPEKIKQAKYLRLPLYNAAIRLPFLHKKSYNFLLSRHGPSIFFLEDGRFYTSEYCDGEFKRQTYFYNNSEITQADFFKMDKGPFYVSGTCFVEPMLPYEIIYDSENYSIRDNQRVLYQPAR